VTDANAAEHERLAREKANQLREQGNTAAAKQADEYADAWAKEQEK
jgi:hypothetical protein